MTILNGLKILDFCSLLPGHFTTMMFADLGADVIHIESERRVDMMRIMPPYDGEHESYIHQHLNRSKKSVQINLKTAEGIDIVKKLIADYDILVEGFRPGVMKRLGIDYETLYDVLTRKQHYCDLIQKISTGQIVTTEQLVAENIDICSFVFDLFTTTDDYGFLYAVYDVLQSFSIIDPACGSGAFLLASLNVLEPLYESCLSRFEFLVSRDTASNNEHAFVINDVF